MTIHWKIIYFQNNYSHAERRLSQKSFFSCFLDGSFDSFTGFRLEITVKCDIAVSIGACDSSFDWINRVKKPNSLLIIEGNIS